MTLIVYEVLRLEVAPAARAAVEEVPRAVDVEAAGAVADGR